MQWESEGYAQMGREESRSDGSTVGTKRKGTGVQESRHGGYNDMTMNEGKVSTLGQCPWVCKEHKKKGER